MSDTGLINRVNRFLVLENTGHLSMAMVVDIITNLSKSYGVPFKSVATLWDQQKAQLDFDKSGVWFDIEERKR